jgi:hypothetical protein
VIDACPDGDFPLVDHGVEQVDPRRRRTVELAGGQDAHGRERSGMLMPGARSSLSDVRFCYFGLPYWHSGLARYPESSRLTWGGS